MDNYSVFTQTALDESESNRTRNYWKLEQLVDLIIDDDIECRLTSDDQFLSAATYASSLLNKDLDINQLAITCLLVLVIVRHCLINIVGSWMNPELSEEDRKSVQNTLEIYLVNS